MVVVRDYAGTVYLARTSGRSQTDGKVFVAPLYLCKLCPLKRTIETSVS
jgi:hypothetical protein